MLSLRSSFHNLKTSFSHCFEGNSGESLGKKGLIGEKGEREAFIDNLNMIIDKWYVKIVVAKVRRKICEKICEKSASQP